MTTRLLFALVLCLAPVTLKGTLPAQSPKGDGTLIEAEPLLFFDFGDKMRFGLKVLKDPEGNTVNKRLTYSPHPKDKLWSNSTVLKIGDKVVEFGSAAGRWQEKDTKLPNGSKSVWVADDIEVSQILEIVPGQPVEVGGVRKRFLDTCLIRYVIENKGKDSPKVGLRILVDTLIGTNDGVPFAVPGLKGLVTTKMDFTTAQDVPEFIQALETADLIKHGTIGQMSFKVGGGLEPPSRVSLTRWSSKDLLFWDVPMVDMVDDSAVVVYWNADWELKPNEKRILGFAYGLGTISSSEGSGQLALTLSGPFFAGDPFTVTAYVKNTVREETLKLELPPGLERVEGWETETVQPSSKGAKDTIVTWKVKAARPGQFVFKARLSTGVSQSQEVTVQARPVLDGGKFALAISGDLARGKVLTLTATVKNPLPKQTLTLTLPQGLEKVEGEGQQSVPSPSAGKAEDESKVAWKVKAVTAGSFNLEVRSSTGTTESKAFKIVEVETDLNPGTQQPPKEVKRAAEDVKSAGAGKDGESAADGMDVPWLWIAVGGGFLVLLLLLIFLARRRSGTYQASPAPYAMPVTSAMPQGEMPRLAPESPTINHTCSKCGGIIQMPRAMMGHKFQCGACGTTQVAGS